MIEPVDVTALRASAGRSWPVITVVEQTASTNADLVADLRAVDHTVLVAEHQSAGRGRLDRSWTTAPGTGLTFSVLLRPSVPMARWAWLPLLTGVALREAVTAVTGAVASLKWPNDLLLQDEDGVARKAAGILAEAAGGAIVIGVGLNISQDRDELPVPTATSIRLATGQPVDRTALLGELLDAIHRHYSSWHAADGDAERSGLAAAYLDACETVGRQVRVTGVDGSQIIGTACGVDRSGRLQVDSDRGCVVIAAGDVEHVRDAPVS